MKLLEFLRRREQAPEVEGPSMSDLLSGYEVTHTGHITAVPDPLGLGKPRIPTPEDLDRLKLTDGPVILWQEGTDTAVV